MIVIIWQFKKLSCEWEIIDLKFIERHKNLKKILFFVTF